MRIAYFISPHGFGHAARGSAVMTAIQTRDADVHFEIFTKIPEWFFVESGVKNFRYHDLLTDIGLVQHNALTEDLSQTIEALNQLLPFDRARLRDLAEEVNRAECQLVVCDIAPLGIAVAQEAGLPALLVENFTWDWIYEGYSDYAVQLKPHINYLKTLFEAADYHIQTEPTCDPRPVDLRAAPASRKTRETPEQVRRKLGVSDTAKLVLMSMGGIFWDYSFLEQSQSLSNVYLVVAGNSQDERRRDDHIITLPRNSDIFHPDLVNGCDAVIGKLGYSTIAEIYQAGVPFGYVARPTFPESPILSAYVTANLPTVALSEAQFQNGSWRARLSDLLSLPRTNGGKPNGADQIAEFICNVKK